MSPAPPADEPTRNGARVLMPPPLLFAGALALAYLLDWIYPIRLFPDATLARFVVGVAVLLASALLAGWAFLHFRRCRTTVFPGRPTTALVRTGPFRYTRNPFYLAILVALAGFAVGHGSVTMLLPLPILFVVLQLGYVRPEERYLVRTFGQPYRDYQSHVRRWL